ncbi:MAG TPA: proprotein convertase P-domain-containing protein [Kofleriaceae bacterium]|nr:proprotein convertase P-domain-containing protein [Kofleriaceae bacterium]
MPVLLVAAAAHADSLRATRQQPMLEVSHTVDLRVADGVATYTVRRMFSNPGTVADQVELEVDLPYGAAATGLRIRANDRWYAGVLMERGKAEALYREMTGYGEAQAKDPALLSWMWADKLALQVFPVMPGTVSTVEYTLTAPTRYEGGRYHVSYPRTAASESTNELRLATPVVTVHPAWGDARTEVIVDGRRVGRDVPVVLLAPTAPAEPTWAGDLELDPTASYVASELVIRESVASKRTFAAAKLSISLQHTYKSDLELALVTPQGASVPVHTREGGDANDLRGTYTVELPEGTHGAGTWRLVVSDHAARDAGTLDAWTLELGTGVATTRAAAQDTPKFIPDAPESESDAGVATISIAPPPISTLKARLGKAVASAKHAFSRLELDLAPQLVPVPKRAQVVFVLDTSYSQGAEGVGAQLDMVRAYLTHVPDAEVELVTYRRRAERVFGRFVPVADLPDALAVAKYRGKLALGIGSALDDGARLAAAALADRKGPRRLVLATDELVRSTLDQATALAALSTLSRDTVVHVVVPEAFGEEGGRLLRRDDGAFAMLATRHHGISVTLEGLGMTTSKALAPVVLELVRPTRIEKVSAPGFELESDVLVEGTGVRLMHDTPDAPDKVRITGMIWSDPFVREVRVSQPFSVQTAAFVFGADEHQQLSEAEQYTLAMKGRAVSPVTSYVAWEPGVRPSTIGLDDADLYGGLLGDGRAGFGAGGGGFGGMPPDLASLVDTSACVEKFQPSAPWSVRLWVETTRDEIVSVTNVSNHPMAACLVETVWNVRLGAGFFAAHQTHAVELSGP